MSYKIMIIDDAPEAREATYRKVFSKSESSKFDPLFIWTHEDFISSKENPVDAYIIDIFLTNGDWGKTETAAKLLLEELNNVPRSAPVFLVSELWGDPNVLSVLKQIGDSSVHVVQYFAWSEFVAASNEGPEAGPRIVALREKVLFELNRWHGCSDVIPRPDDTIKILLISDPQFGDPNTDVTGTFDDHAIANFLKRENNVPDLIAIAGDITHSGRPDQFSLAIERLTLDLMGPLWGGHNIDRNRNRIIVVPGNHDVNLRFSACDGIIYCPSKRLFTDEPPSDSGNCSCHHEYALEPFRRFAYQLTNDRQWEDTKTFSWVDRRFRNWGIQFFMLNSVAFVNSKHPDCYKLEEDALRKIGRSLGSEKSQEIYNIAISHHGLPEDDISDTEKVRSGISNWPEIKGFFSNENIRLWLFGHKHDFSSSSVNSEPFTEKPLWLIQAPTLRIGRSTRGFCLLELTRKEGVVTDTKIHHYTVKKGAIKHQCSREVFK